MNPHRILIVGYSDFARRVIIPTIESLPAFALTGIASKSHADDIPKHIAPYPDYKRAIDQSGAETAYISLHNSAHATWIQYALSRGKHVIVDKPAVLHVYEARRCIKAAGKSLLLWESLPYLFHPQHRVVKNRFHSTNAIQSITAHFGFPTLHLTNFRHLLNLGGGCLFDLAPYPISVGEYYFGHNPSKVRTTILSSDRAGLPLRASITMEYPNGQYLEGIVGFGLEYQNFISLWGPKAYVYFNRPFTLPPTEPNDIHLHVHNKESVIHIPPASAFARMMTAYLRTLRRQTYHTLNRKWYHRSVVLDAIVRSSKNGRTQIIRYD